MKLISWNVNGLRACIQKGFLDHFTQLNADFFCLQETKLQQGQLQLDLPGYEQYWCYAQKKGYSGTAIFTRHTPISVSYGLGIEELDTEGRLITLEYPEFFLVTCYTPNAQRGLARLEHRMRWDEAFRNYISGLDQKKPVIICGDLNVAHQEIDLKNPGSNHESAGFSDAERESFTKTLCLGFTDTFRYLNPDAKGQYTWWSYMYHARENNAGWRIDYFLTSDRLREQIYRAPIHSDIMGSDHCPVSLEIDLPCNGSIWVSNQPENATVVPKPIPQVSLTKKNIGILALTLVLFFLTGLLTGRGIAPGQPSATDPLVSDSTAAHSLLPDVQVFDSSLVLTRELDKRLNYYGSSVNSMFYAYENRNEHLFLTSSDYATQTHFTDVNFYMRVDLTSIGRTKYSGNPTLQVTSRGIVPLPETIQCTPYYTSTDRTTVGGWIIQGNLLCPTNLILSLSAPSDPTNITVVYQGTIFPLDYTPEQEARSLSTNALVTRVLQLDAIHLYCGSNLGHDESVERYRELETIFPILQALRDNRYACSRLNNLLSNNGLSVQKKQIILIILDSLGYNALA